MHIIFFLLKTFFLIRKNMAETIVDQGCVTSREWHLWSPREIQWMRWGDGFIKASLESAWGDGRVGLHGWTYPDHNKNMPEHTTNPQHVWKVIKCEVQVTMQRTLSGPNPPSIHPQPHLHRRLHTGSTRDKCSICTIAWVLSQASFSLERTW